jgi:hypothetical protein
MINNHWIFHQERNTLMAEKPIVQKQVQEEQPSEKKNYTPPTLTLYGKMTELTGGGSISAAEPGSSMKPDMMT